MRSFNNVDMGGRLYAANLTTREFDDDTAITGSISVEVDENGTIAEIQFFAKPKFKSGKTNSTYTILEKIMDGEYKTVVDDGDDADWINVKGSISVSYFAPKGGAKSVDELARAQKIRGLFINQNTRKTYTNKWKIDMIINYVREIEADPEKGYDRYAVVGGYLINDFAERIEEVRFDIRKEAGINYILSMDISEKNKMFVSIWGGLGMVKIKRVVKGAWGDDDIEEFSNTRWVVTSLSDSPYDMADDDILGLDTYETFSKNLTEYLEEVFKKDQMDSERENLAF